MQKIRNHKINCVEFQYQMMYCRVNSTFLFQIEQHKRSNTKETTELYLLVEHTLNT